ncbi:MAG: hypothetical protein ACLRXC_11000 [[Clostridium] leptum]
MAESGDDRGFSGGQRGIDLVLFALFMLCKPKYRRGSLALVCAMVAGFLLEIFLKNLVMRPRPAGNFGGSHAGGGSHDYSFPSVIRWQHFTAASVIFCVNRRAGAAAFLFAALMGFPDCTFLYIIQRISGWRGAQAALSAS